MVVVMLLIYAVLHCLYSVGNKITTTTTNKKSKEIESSLLLREMGEKEETHIGSGYQNKSLQIIIRFGCM